MTKEDENKMNWSESIADLIADALFVGGIIKEEDFKNAVEIIAEELFVRLLVSDYPPPYDFKLLPEKNNTI